MKVITNATTRVADMNYQYEKEIKSLSPDNGDHFGGNIEISKDYYVISAKNDNYTGTAGVPTIRNGGSVFLYSRQGSSKFFLRSTFPIEDGEFGAACTIAGNILVIAEYRPSYEHKSVLWFFELPSGNPLLNISVPRSQYYQRILHSLGGDILFAHIDGMKVISANPSSPDFGTVVHSFSSKQKQFQSVHVSSEMHIYSGNPFNKENGRIGKVYMYEGNRLSGGFGSLMTVFEDPRPNISGQFGWEMETLNGILYVGSYTDSLKGKNSGAVHLFDADPSSKQFGQYICTLENPKPSENARFGLQLTASGHRLIVSAPSESSSSVPQSREGEVYIVGADPSSKEFGTIVQQIERPLSLPHLRRFGDTITSFGNDCLLIASSTDGGRVFLYKNS